MTPSVHSGDAFRHADDDRKDRDARYRRLERLAGAREAERVRGQQADLKREYLQREAQRRAT